MALMPKEEGGSLAMLGASFRALLSGEGAFLTSLGTHHGFVHLCVCAARQDEEQGSQCGAQVVHLRAGNLLG